MSPVPSPAAPFALSLPECLEALTARLEGVARVAAGALACASAGAEDEAVRLALELEPGLHDADRLLSAVALIYRLRRERRG